MHINTPRPAANLRGNCSRRYYWLVIKRRSDPRVARRVVDSIFEAVPGKAKQSYCKFLGASIAYLSQHHPDRWGVTLFEDERVVRLNAGIVESLVLHPGWLRVLVHRETAPPRTNFHREPNSWEPYKNAPGCGVLAIPLSELPRTLATLTESHHRALEKTATRRLWLKTLNAHSTGVTKWLSQALGDPVPNPANWPPCAKPSETAMPAAPRSERHPVRR